MKKINLVQKIEHKKIEHKLEDNFLPYKESLELKKLGFDYLCFAYYVGKDEELHYIGQYVQNTNFSLNSRVAFRCPLYQQAFQWFREKHEIFVSYQGDFRNNYFDVVRHGVVLECIEEKDYRKGELRVIRKIIQILKEK